MRGRKQRRLAVVGVVLGKPCDKNPCDSRR
jgi:hypothetical protein